MSQLLVELSIELTEEEERELVEILRPVHSSGEFTRLATDYAKRLLPGHKRGEVVNALVYIPGDKWPS